MRGLAGDNDHTECLPGPSSLGGKQLIHSLSPGHLTRIVILPGEFSLEKRSLERAMHDPKEYFTLEKFQLSAGELFFGQVRQAKVTLPHPHPKEEKINNHTPVSLLTRGRILAMWGARVIAITYSELFISLACQ